MQNINKKGISNVLAIVIISVISVLCVSLLYSSLGEIYKGKSLEIAYSCLDLKLSEPINLYKTCFNNNTKNIDVYLIEKNKMLSESKIDFSLNEDGQSIASWSCGGNCEGCNFGIENDKYFLPASDIELNYSKDLILSIQVENCVRYEEKLVMC